MDLSQFSDADLQALSGGDLTKVSDAGLQVLHQGMSAGQPAPAAPTAQADYTTQIDPTLNATSPVLAEIKQGVGNMAIGAGALYTDVGQRAHQLYNFITGGPSMDAEILAKRATDKQINSTYGGMLGRAGAVAPGMALTGSAVGANALYGGVLGALQPTTSTGFGGNLGATAFNTGVGAALSGGMAAIGKGLARWAPQRAEYPIMGHTPASADTTLARGVGSDAANLGNGAAGARGGELGDIFNAGRSSATSIDLSGTPAVMDKIGANLNPSARALFENEASDLMSHATGAGNINGQMLGQISTGLRQASHTALNSEGGNREVGLALQQLREHVEDQIQSNIADPALRAAYSAARPQYGLLQDVRYNPSLLNASTGRANMENLGKYLQRNNPAYTAEGAMDNPVFNAAMWGQRGGGAKGAPSFSLPTFWKLPYYGLTHNPVARATGGVVSRAVAPVAPAIPYGLSGLGTGTVPIALPYLEQ